MILEKNIFKKNLMKSQIRIALTYPNIYKTAMSSSGFQLIYNFINERNDSWCERIIYPNNKSIESNSPLKDFDIISFSLQYEEDYFNVLKLLKSANIPLKRKDRDNNHPLIIAGGPSVSSNPMPLSNFIDLFLLGDGEIIINDFLDLYKSLNNPKNSLKEFSKIKGIYIPQINNKVQIAIANDLNSIYHNTHPIIVETENDDYKPVFNNSILLNISRGCTRGCRFCMSGYLYRPMRETSVEKLIEIAENSRNNSGFNKINLIGAGVGDYSRLNELIDKLKKRDFEISTPSLRLESLNRKTLERLKDSGLKTLTIAPESIYKLRKSINKNISDEKIETVIKDALDLNLKIKLYFLIGLTNESNDDIIELAKYIHHLNNLSHKKSMTFSINPTIPKAHTPLQWDKYDLNSMKSKIKYLKKELKNINFNISSAKMGLIQYICSCGGCEVGDLIEKSLNEKVSIKEWMKYIPDYDFNSKLPWDNINTCLKSDFLKKERMKIDSNEETPWCVSNECYNCGSCANMIN